MKRLLMTVGLVCILSSSALAGDVPTVGSPAPTGTVTTTPTSPGDIPTGGLADQTSSATLSALLTVLGLLGI